MPVEPQDALVALIVAAAALYLWRRLGPRPRREIVATLRASSLRPRRRPAERSSTPHAAPPHGGGGHG